MNSRIAFVHWDRETIDFLIATPNSQKLSPQDIGSVPRGDHANPLKALAEYFEQQEIMVGRLVVLLSRPELDQLQLDLPPASVRELPALVASGVEERLGEADEPPRVDFLMPTGFDAQSADASQATSVWAFALSFNELRALEKDCEAAGFRLEGIGSRHLSPLGVLNRREIFRESVAISIHMYAAEVELVICRHSTPLLLRSIRTNPDAPQRVAEQIWSETRRCLTLLPEEPSGDEITWCVFSTSDYAQNVALGLQDRGLDVQTIDPLLGWHIAGPMSDAVAEETPTELPGSSAANSGAAWEFAHGGLPVNFLEPKRSPPPPNPYLRWGVIGTAATLALAVGVGFLLSDVRALEIEAADLERQLADAKKITAKYQSKADQVTFVENWLSDQVDWLAELEQLSKRLPQGQSATVRRLTAATVDRTAVFDLSVQVAKQENISDLEHGIRSAKYSSSSKSINQKANESEYPWQFETRITFPIDPPDSRSYAPPADASTDADLPSAARKAGMDVASKKRPVEALPSAKEKK
ncbi:MAG: hypothetical protein NXI32_14115 [bacterium]|nr:hypothetical protein [bacterium]